MASLVKTLKNKASQSRLRNKHSVIHEEPLPDLPTGDYSSQSENSRKSFWRRRDHTPTPPMSEAKSPNLTSLSPPQPPKSILRPHYSRSAGSAPLPQDRRHTLVPYSRGFELNIPDRPESARTATPPNKQWQSAQTTPTQQNQNRRASVRWSPPLHAPKPVTPREIPMLSSPISLDSPVDSPPSSSPQTPSTPVRQAVPGRRSTRPPSSASSVMLKSAANSSKDSLPPRAPSAASMSSRRRSSRPGSSMGYSTRSSIASISTITSSYEPRAPRLPTHNSYYVIPQAPAPPRPRSIARKPVPSLVETSIPLPLKSSPTPSFNVIPPTPETRGEAFENANMPAPRTSTSSGRPNSVILLDTMPEEEEEDGAKTPKLEAPIQLENVKQLDDLDSEESSDDCQTPSEMEVLRGSPQRPLPPRGAKSPARQWELYGGYDDGRSISHSLAELARLACDLPALDADLAENAAHASEAHRRFLAARALVDATESPDMSHTPKARPAPSAPPKCPLPARPTAAAPVVPPRSDRRVTAHTRKRAQSTDTWDSQGSLPSLVSVDTVSSGMGSSSSQSSMESSPDVEEATNVLRSMTLEGVPMPSTPKAQVKMMASSLPETPNPGLGLGLVLDVGGLAPSTPKHMRTTSEQNSASTPPKRLPVIRDSRRSGFYGTPVASQSMTSIRSFSAARDDMSHHHLRQASVASSLASNVSDEEDLLSASIVAIPPGAVSIVGREDPRSHEIGVAF